MLAKRASSIAPLTASAFVRRQAERTSCRLHRQRIGRTITDLRPTYDTLCGTPAQAHLSVPAYGERRPRYRGSRNQARAGSLCKWSWK